MPQYRRVVDDTDAPIEDTLTADGSAVDISGFNRVEFHLEKPDGTVVTDDDTGNVTVENSPNGEVKYDFASDDLNQTGQYRYEWQVEFGDGGIQTYPSALPATIYVRNELDS